MDASIDSLIDELLDSLAGPRLLDHLVDMDELRCSHSLLDADARLRARVRLYRHLIDAGWQPPASVVRNLERDEELLTRPVKEPVDLAQPG